MAADFEAELSNGAGGQFDGKSGGTVAGIGSEQMFLCGERLVFDLHFVKGGDLTPGIQENQVDGHQAASHDKGQRLRLGEDKEHAAIVCDVVAVAKTLEPLGVGEGQFKVEGSAGDPDRQGFERGLRAELNTLGDDDVGCGRRGGRWFCGFGRLSVVPGGWGGCGFRRLIL